MLNACQAAYQRRTRCDDDVDAFECFLASPAEHTVCSAARSQYCRKTDHQCIEDVVYVKTETKHRTQNTYASHFL